MSLQTTLRCHPRQNARTLVVGTMHQWFKISVLRVGTLINPLRLLHLSRTPLDPLVLLLVRHRISAQVRVHRFPLLLVLVVSILAHLPHRKIGCNPRHSLDLDPDHTALLPSPMGYHHLNG